jgi:hypothetical protein
MNTHSIQGRPWAKLSDLKEGSKIELDSGFTCHKAGVETVHLDEDGKPFFKCRAGRHALAGQADDGEHCVGVFDLIKNL